MGIVLPRPAQGPEGLLQAIRCLSHDHKKRVGSPRFTWALRHERRPVGKNRVARLMRQNVLRAKAARKFKATTYSNYNGSTAPSLATMESGNYSLKVEAIHGERFSTREEAKSQVFESFWEGGSGRNEGRPG